MNWVPDNRLLSHKNATIEAIETESDLKKAARWAIRLATYYPACQRCQKLAHKTVKQYVSQLEQESQEATENKGALEKTLTTQKQNLNVILKQAVTVQKLTESNQTRYIAAVSTLDLMDKATCEANIELCYWAIHSFPKDNAHMAITALTYLAN